MSAEDPLADVIASLGSIKDIPRDELVEIADSIWELLPANCPHRFEYATTIAGAFHDQYTKTDESEFNQRALQYLQQVLDLTSQASRSAQASYGETCAKSFLAQGITFNSDEDLDEAIECSESSVMLTDYVHAHDHTALLL